MPKGFSEERIKKALDEINKTPFRSLHWKQQLTSVEFWAFGLLFGSLALCFASALAFHFGILSRHIAFPTSIVSLAIAEVGFWIMAARNAWSGFREADQNVTRRNSSAILADVRLISVCRTLSTDELSFLSKRIQLNADQLRSRIGFLIGPVDKVGTVPLAIGTIWALLKAPEVTQAKTPVTIIVLFGLVLFYLTALLFTMRSHRIDECAQVLELAESQVSQIEIDV
ncbi:hypothetical protein HNQ77_002258 [Silvibacterium bohemicum]|uniref:Uncharacterized protein n=1 Tax=Silvibacterium bohemicum TaxID=1577686 RepID=A0A841JSM3_9BACT|nr:hypothetical protein [Silvibacterium bohemicum]MBB6144306.1 hypothetical protein [Silvibacterium bohemicum]